MSYNKYIGSRYVPLQCGDWVNTKEYESLSVVQYQGASYTANCTVPKGIDINNTQFWVRSADYNAQMEIYRQEVINFNGQIQSTLVEVSENSTEINNAKSGFDTLDSRLDYLQNGLTHIYVENFKKIEGENDDTLRIKRAINSTTQRSILHFAPIDYYISDTLYIPPFMKLKGERNFPQKVADLATTNMGTKLSFNLPDGELAIRVNTGTYSRCSGIEDIYVYGNDKDAEGVYIRGIGCATISGLVVEGFKRTGLTFDFVQDIDFTRSSVSFCGTDKLYPAFKIIGHSNAIRTSHFLLEGCPYAFYINDAVFCDFVESHIEQGDYPSEPAKTALKAPYSEPSIRFIKAYDIKFTNCIFIPTSRASIQTEYNLSGQDLVPYYMNSDDTSDIRFVNCDFLSPMWSGIKVCDFSTAKYSTFIGCHFKGLTESVTPMKLKNSKIIGSVLTFNSNAQNYFNGLTLCGNTIIENNTFDYIVQAESTKTMGALFLLEGNENAIGYNSYNTNCPTYFSGTAKSLSKFDKSSYTMIEVGGVSTINLNSYNSNNLVFSTNTTVTQINSGYNGEVLYLYASNANVTLTYNPSKIITKGGVDCVIPSGGIVVLRHSIAGDVWNEVSRNF